MVNVTPEHNLNIYNFSAPGVYSVQGVEIVTCTQSISGQVRNCNEYFNILSGWQSLYRG
jgi:hypothetical protein